MKVPRHVAVIMDGNGRWAQARSLPRFAGHRAGVESVREAVRTCAEQGVEVLTLYSFSTENWLRPKEEIEELMGLLSWALKRETLKLDEQNIRLRTIGRIDGLPESARRELQASVDRLSGNTGMVLTLALNYGSRQELVDAFNELLASGVQAVNEEEIASRLYTRGLPDPDLVIRTSGEMRLSNFLLWQLAYAELYVTPVLWPDFRREHMVEAFAEYGRRERRFGNVAA